MIQRCTNPNTIGYKWYGGKGIEVCAEWQDFENFEHDMFPSYRPGLTLDRKDSNKNYCKSNCKWSTRSEQAFNRSSTRRLRYRGITDSVAGWARRIGISKGALSFRLQKGDSIGVALSSNRKDHPIGRPQKYVKYDNKTLTIREWAIEWGVSYQTAWKRTRKLK